MVSILVDTSPEKSKGGDRHLRKLVSRILRIASPWRELQLRRIDCTCSSRIRSSSSKPFPLHLPSAFPFFLRGASPCRRKEVKERETKRENEKSENLSCLKIFLWSPRCDPKRVFRLRLASVLMAPTHCIGSSRNGDETAIVNRTEVLSY